MLLVDMSASGRFGSRGATKRELAAELAALLAFSAIKNNDRVGLIIFTDRGRALRAAQEGQEARAARDQRDPLVRRRRAGAPSSASGSTSSGASRAGARSCSWSRTFWRRSPSCERALRIAAQRHDLVPVSVSDPLEEALPDVGLHRARGPGDRRHGACSTPAGPRRRRSRARRARRSTAREALFKRLAMDAIDVRTDRPYLPALTAVLRGAGAEAAALRRRGVAVAGGCGGRAGGARRCARAAQAPTRRARRRRRGRPRRRRSGRADGRGARRTAPRRTSAIRSASASSRSPRARAGQPARRRSIWGRFRC